MTETLAVDERQIQRARGPRYGSLQRFLLFIVVMSVAVPATLTGFLLIRENFYRTVDHDSREMANNYIELLEAGMTMPLWNIAADLGQPLIDSVSIDPAVTAIEVKAVHGESFLSYTRQESFADDSQIEVTRDIIYEGEKLGQVTLVYSLARAKSRAVAESRLLLTIIIIQLVFTIVLVSYFLRRRVVTPVKLLEQAAVGIAEGDLKTAIPPLNDDEFGALSLQLERMRGSLESSFTTLEDRVRERTVDLVEVNQELQQTLDQLKQTQGNLVQSEKLAALGSLVAGVAHELNTPIGNGLTVASSLFDESRSLNRQMEEGLTRSALETYVNDMIEGTSLVVSSLDRASELVSSFKQVAMDRTSAQRRNFDLLAVLKETKLTVSPAFKHTPYVVDIECDEAILLDSYPGPLGQIVTNLLNNTLIHAFDGRDHGRALIRGQKLGDDQCLVSVTDDGAGIPEANLKRIFDPFFTTKLGEGGNGLGMHIVHNLVTGVLGGTIEVSSKLGEGTTFTMVVPIKAPQRDDHGMVSDVENS
ncbi:sensor histidine kinase [Agaribacterium haliotis]|uniref:sensor histidine kinase n=1 Tax=Agaribacterium haliotis TaxID=2013869 RepID=UPI001EFE4CC3|nr:ATP-binding protein [Agaribacterium haliotis]